jgi:hypothetical protein
MSRPGLPEWSGDTLVYVSAGQSVARFGYAPVSQRKDVSPDERALYLAIEERVPLQDGDVAAERHDFGDPREAAGTVKALARELGADLVGITRVDPHYVYEGHDLDHDFAIVLAIAMDYEEGLLEAPRPESIHEHIRVYDELSVASVRLAEQLRAAGYAARAHTMRGEDLAMLPHAQAAGLGELGKHGSLINRELGCSFRIGVVTTQLELAVDSPRDEGIQDFCRRCRMCTTYLPGRRDQRRDGLRARNRALARGHRAVRALLLGALRLRGVPPGLPDQRQGIRRTPPRRLRPQDATARRGRARREPLGDSASALDRRRARLSSNSVLRGSLRAQ